jgi:hypothetical protein
MVGNVCLATDHQRHLLTGSCSLGVACALGSKICVNSALKRRYSINRFGFPVEAQNFKLFGFPIFRF